MINSKVLLATCMIGVGYGVMEYRHDLNEATSVEEDVAVYTRIMRYGPIAAAMVDVAFNLRFEYPPDYQIDVYVWFGDWYGDFMSDSRKHEEPSHEQCLERLVELTYESFSDLFEGSSTETLQETIQAVADGYK